MRKWGRKKRRKGTKKRGGGGKRKSNDQIHALTRSIERTQKPPRLWPLIFTFDLDLKFKKSYVIICRFCIVPGMMSVVSYFKRYDHFCYIWPSPVHTLVFFPDKTIYGQKLVSVLKCSCVWCIIEALLYFFLQFMDAKSSAFNLNF